LNIGSEGLFPGSKGLESPGARSYEGLRDLGASGVIGSEEFISSISGRSNDILFLMESLVTATSFNGRISVGFETFFRIKRFLGSYSLMNSVLVIVFLVGI